LRPGHSPRISKPLPLAGTSSATRFPGTPATSASSRVPKKQTRGRVRATAWARPLHRPPVPAADGAVLAFELLVEPDKVFVIAFDENRGSRSCAIPGQPRREISRAVVLPRGLVYPVGVGPDAEVADVKHVVKTHAERCLESEDVVVSRSMNPWMSPAAQMNMCTLHDDGEIRFKSGAAVLSRISPRVAETRVVAVELVIAR
jgi:hypothetical protein